MDHATIEQAIQGIRTEIYFRNWQISSLIKSDEQPPEELEEVLNLNRQIKKLTIIEKQMEMLKLAEDIKLLEVHG